MPTYIQKTTAASVSPFTLFNKEISAGTGSDTTLVVNLSSSQTASGGFLTVVDKPNSDAWEDGGTWTVELEVDVGNHQVTARCRCVRVDVAGNIEESGAYTSTQTLDATRSFSPVAPTWETSGDTNVCSDQIAIEVEFINGQAMTNSVTLGLGTAANEVITDITEDSGTCGGGDITVTPAVLTLVTGKVDPTTVLGSLTISPAFRTLVTAVIAPTVLNFVLLTPSVLSLVTNKIDPLVELGSVVVTPAPATLVTGKVEPTVVLGSLNITPAILTLVTGKIEPTVVLGSISLTPAVRTLVATVVDPTVILSAQTQKQIFVAGPGQQGLGPGITRYNTVLSTRVANANWENTEVTFQLIATPGTLRNLRIQLDTAVTAGSLTFTLRKNAVDTALEVVMTSGTSGIDITNDVTVVSGDQINLKVVTSGNNSVQAKFGLEFEGDNDKAFNMSAGTSFNLLQTAATQFNTLIHHDAWNTDGGDRINVCPLDGTITDWYLELPTAPGTGESWTFRIVKNLTSEASSEIVISGTGTTGNVTGLSIDIAPGDEIQMQAIRSSASVVVSAVQSGVAIKADVQGESWVGGNTDDILTKTDTATEYNLMGGGDRSWVSAESAALQYAAGAFTLKDFRVRTNVGPGGTTDHQYTFRLRKDEADGNSVVTLIDAETDKVDSTNEDSYSAGTEIGVSHRYDLTGSGTPNTMRVSWAAIQTIDENILVTPAAATLVTGKVDPTVVLGSLTLTPAVRTLVTAVVDPTVTVSGGDITVTPATLTLVTATVNPTVVLGSLLITPATLTLVTGKIDPAVELGSLSITPAVRTLVTATINPTVVLGSLTITPAVLTGVWAVIDPTVEVSGGDVVVTPAALTLVTGRVNPTVVLGSVTVTPAVRTLVTATIAPTVLTPTIITPATLTLVTGKIDPTVVLGSLVITPAVTTLVTSKVDPTVVLGSFSFTPSPLTLVTGKVEPTVVLGSLTITPSVRTLVTLGVDPGIPTILIPAILTLVTTVGQPTVINSGDVIIEIFIINEQITQPKHANEAILQPKHANEKITIY